MRSRYSAYKLGLHEYLLKTWHGSTRPQALDLSEPLNWLGLKVISQQNLDAQHELRFAVGRGGDDGSLDRGKGAFGSFRKRVLAALEHDGRPEYV